MEHDLDQLLQICMEAVYIAHNVVAKPDVESRDTVEVEGKDEIVTKADLDVLKVWREYFGSSRVPMKVLTEESRNNPFVTLPNPVYFGVGDELDGTRNWKRAKGILPYCAIFTIGLNSQEPRFQDALATAVLNHQTGDLWTAIKGRGCAYNGKRVHTSGKSNIDDSALIIIDRGPCPDPEHSLRYFNLEQKCGQGNVGSAGIHMAGVSSGSVSGWDGYCCMIQKPEELISGNLLITEAGGCLIDTSGNPIAQNSFDWNKKYEVIAGATPELAQLIRKELLSKKQAADLYARIKINFW